MQGLEAAVGCRPTDTACTGGGSTAGAGARPALQGLLPAAALCLSHSARQGGGGQKEHWTGMTKEEAVSSLL